MKKNYPQTEQEFLLEKADQAKCAIKAAAGDLQKNLGSILNIEAWVKKYPWQSLGAGVVAGFAAGYWTLPSPSPDSQAHPAYDQTHPKPEVTEAHEKFHALKATIGSTLSALALDMSREFIQQWLQKPKTSDASDGTPETPVPSPS